jgi:hypothetical protein
MQEVFFTVLAIWVIWKLFSAFSGSSSAGQQRASNHFYQTNHNHYQETKPEGEVVIEDKTSKSGTKRKPEEGEYVDYEEIK